MEIVETLGGFRVEGTDGGAIEIKSDHSGMNKEPQANPWKGVDFRGRA